VSIAAKINARSSRRQFQQFQATSFEDSFSESGLFAVNDSTEIGGWAPANEIVFQKNDNHSDAGARRQVFLCFGIERARVKNESVSQNSYESFRWLS
jgi:hypothetical protein